MAPPPHVPELLDELVEEVLLRFPPDDPASLVRAAIVCKLWCRLVSTAAFRRRFREFHRKPPLLGILCQDRGGDGDVHPTARFIPTSSFHPARDVRYGWRAVDARHGRVLLEYWPCEDPYEDDGPFRTKLIVWDPVTNKQRKLPSLLMVHNVFPRTWNAAVICAAGGSCNHRYCNWGSFVVVFVGIKHDQICSCIYSSKTGAWSDQTFSEPQYLLDLFKPAPGLLIRNTLYFLFNRELGIVKYDLTMRKASVIDIPPELCWQHLVLMPMEDGRLGFATMDRCRLHINLWSRVIGPDGDAGFAQCGVINLPKALNAPESSPRVNGFAHDVGVLFIRTFYGLYSMDIKSEHVRKVPTTRYCQGFTDVVPYLNFHTPGTALFLYDLHYIQKIQCYFRY
ncbi:unnamed protein product [Urochloa decumbens]|uniref:F-box domain-containing protein n=1 Tax=Urochloa decumbens TaxID=240449 RepID=A0ABC9GEG8_9POAL